jgi:hypothetical protein
MGMDSVIITLPLPDKKLHAHNTGHWRSKAGAVKTARTRAKVLGLQALGGRKVPFFTKIEYRFYFGANTRRDVVNAMQSMKADCDGLVDAGLIEDDCWQKLEVQKPHVEIDRENPRVELVLSR